MRRLLERFDRYQQRHAWLGFPIAVGRKFGEDQATNLAALIAYYGFFSFFPLLLVLVTVLGYVVAGHPAVQQSVVSSVLTQFPVIGDQLRDNVHGLHGNAVALAVGLAGALWGGLAVANAAQTAMNTVWQVPVADRPSFLVRTLRSLLLVVVLGAVILATTVISGLSAGARSYGVALGLGVQVLAVGVALVVNVVAFAVAFRVLTDQDVRTRDVLPGAVVAAVGWQVLQLVGGYYLAHTVKGASQTYGTFAIVIGLLTWFYLQAQLTLFAAELNVVRSRRLWPRSLLDPPRTKADHRSYEGYADLARYLPEERVEVTFPHRKPAAGVPGLTTEGREMATGGDDRSAAELMRDLTAQISRLVKDELQLARLELAEKGRRVGVGAGLAGVGALSALYGVAALLAAIVLGLATVWPPWLAALVVAAVLLVTAGALTLLARAQLKRATPPVPEETVASIRTDIETVKERAHR